MLPEELPEPVRTLLTRHVPSLDALAILMALVDSDGRWWDVGTMAAYVGMSPRVTRRVLESFASGNLLDIRISDEVRYQLHPGTPLLAEQVAAVREAYRRSPAAMLRWVAARGSMAGFGDAFRFKG